MMVTNMLSSAREKPNADPIRKAFDDRVMLLPPCDANTVVIAKTGAPIRIAMDRLRSSAHKLKIRTGLNLLPTLSRLRSNVIL